MEGGLMGYINVGVDSPYNVSKKALKGGCAVEPEKVWFYSTALFGQQFFGSALEIPEGTSLTVVGPDPATSRKWYATVEMRDGKVRVS
jgi:hypothetical protein